MIEARVKEGLGFPETPPYSGSYIVAMAMSSFERWIEEKEEKSDCAGVKRGVAPHREGIGGQETQKQMGAACTSSCPDLVPTVDNRTCPQPCLLFWACVQGQLCLCEWQRTSLKLAPHGHTPPGPSAKEMEPPAQPKHLILTTVSEMLVF